MDTSTALTVPGTSLRSLVGAFVLTRMTEGKSPRTVEFYAENPTDRIHMRRESPRVITPYAPDEIKRMPLTQENEIYVGDAFPREDVSTVRSIIWRFVGLGILTPRMMTVDDRNQFFEISHYGRQVLEEERESPYDPLGFLQRLSTDSPNLESNTIEYIQEAVNCCLGRYLRAATVMVGLASENEILTLLEKYENTLDPDEKTEFDREKSSCQNLKMKFDVLYNRLYREKRKFPLEIREIETWLNGIFQVIRLSRNDAGHPIGVNPTSEDVFANIVLFRTYARYISKLKEYLDAKARLAP